MRAPRIEDLTMMRPRAAGAMACLLTLLLGAGCGRQRAPNPFHVASVTTAARWFEPGQAIDVSLRLENRGARTIRLLDIVLDAAPAVLPRAELVLMPTRLEPGESADALVAVTLPAPFDRLHLSATITGFNEHTGKRVIGHSDDAALTLERGLRTTPVVADLMVTVTDDELDGGAGAASVDAVGGNADLSLREAIVIANNRPGSDVIGFDPVVFSATTAGVINFDGTLGAMTILDAETVIDANERGVTIEGINSGGVQALLIEADGTFIRGLTVVGFIDTSVQLDDAGSVRFEAVAVTSRNNGSTSFVCRNCPSLVVVDSVLRGSNPLSLSDSTDFSISGCHLEGASPLRLSNSSRGVVADNYLRSTSNPGLTLRLTGATGVTVRANEFDNRYLQLCLELAAGSVDARIEGNLFSFCGVPSVSIGAMSQGITLHANAISFDATGAIEIVAGGNGDVLPPVLTRASAPVQGTSTAPQGVIELFMGDDDVTSTYLGEAVVAANGTWSLAPTVSLVSGRLLWATVTDTGGNTSAFSAALAVP